MRKDSKKILKAGITLLIVSIFVLCAIPVSAITSSEQQLFFSMNKNVETVGESVWRSVPESGLIYLGFPLLAKLTDNPYLAIKVSDWTDKPFPYTTLMWFGNGIGFRPSLPVVFILLGDPYAFHTVEIYSDGELYSTSISLNGLVPIVYYEKGFHHLEIVPEGYENDTLEIDVQIGLHGFVQNILPYLS